jgi:serine/threonine protein kinase
MMHLKHQPELYDLITGRSHYFSWVCPEGPDLSRVFKQVPEFSKGPKDPEMMIGFGSSGCVYRVNPDWVSDNSPPMVIKIISESLPTQRFYPIIYNEVSVLAMISSEEIMIKKVPRLYGVVRYRDKLAIIMDQMPGVELFSLIERRQLGPGDRSIIFRQLLELTQSLVKHRLVNLDLKLENLIYDQATQHLSMIDLGGVYRQDASSCFLLSYVGSHGYISPERLVRDYRNAAGLTPAEIAINCMTWITGMCIIMMMTEAMSEWDKRTRQYVFPELGNDKCQGCVNVYNYIRESIVVPITQRANLDSLAEVINAQKYLC